MISLRVRFAGAFLALLTSLLGPPPPSVSAEPAPAPAVAAASPRALGESQREAMLQILADPTISERKVWFAVGPADPEAKALEQALRGIFEKAGWSAQTRTITGMRLKPGLSMLAADEESPSWVAVVQQALDASGLPVKYGSGYRPYYEEMKRTNPSWVGVPIEADQAFVVVVGPRPET